MRNALTLTMVLLLALAGSCKQNEVQTTEQKTEGATAQASAMEMTPEQLGELGAQIRKSPDRAQELLGQHGLTEATFEAQIRKVTENPEASKRYAEAYKKASA